MKQLTPKARKELKIKMDEALSDKITPLSKGLRDVLFDDLVTAFENRLAALNPEQSNMRCFISERVEVLNETV